MELVLRAAFIYAFVFLVLRVSGKRQFSELSTFDFVVLLILSEGVSQGLYGADDFSLTSAVLLVSTFVAVDILLSHVKQWLPTVDRVMEGGPVLLVNEGKLVESALKAERVAEEDILESARASFGLESLDHVRYAILEKNGSISIIPSDLPYVSSQS